jgi:hypothetical protein
MNTEKDAAASPGCDATMRNTRNVVVGFLAGSVVGAGLGWYFAPRLSALGHQTAGSLQRIGAAATRGYHEAGGRLGAVVDTATAKGQALRDQVSDAVIRGARDVERLAAHVKSARGPEGAGEVDAVGATSERRP